MTNTSFEVFRDSCKHRLEVALDKLLPKADQAPTRLHQAMRYSVLAPGKRIRPLLTYATAHTLGMNLDLLDPAACAVEMIHVYSLIHDDLPAMDDDDLRRGMPTCHKAFDEATAILAGDSLQPLACEALSLAPGLGSAERCAMVRALCQASGSLGMAAGQALDLEAESRQIDLTELEYIHLHKTGALIRVAVALAVAAADQEGSTQAQDLDEYARSLGLAFQIQDDILDVEGTTSELGKTAGRDETLSKATYPSLLGLDAAKKLAQQNTDKAMSALSRVPGDTQYLEGLAHYLLTRKN